MSSVLTNRTALQTLQALKTAQGLLAQAQGRTSTGLKVAGARDNAAIYAIAQTMRSERGGWEVVNERMARIRSGLDVAEAAMGQINEALLRLTELGTSYADPSASSASRQAIRDNMEALILQIEQQAKMAEFDGLNFLTGDFVNAVVSSQSVYSLPSSSQTPLSFLTPMAGGTSAGIQRSMTTTTQYRLAYSALTPSSFTEIAGRSAMGSEAVASQDRSVYSAGSTVPLNSATYTNTAYDQAGQISFWVDAFTEDTVIEVWQNGRRVAASGQTVAANGQEVAAGIAVTGQRQLSFAYDPARGKNLEIRSSGTDSFAVHGSTWPGQGSAKPTEQRANVHSFSDNSELVDESLRPETAGRAATNQGEWSGTIDAGPTAGRVDLLLDAFDNPDVVEIWQGGVRVAATGQPKANGGSAVAAGTPVSGQSVLSFDYDPSAGQALEFRFNQGRPHDDAGWVVAGLELYPSGAPATATGFTPTTSQTITTHTQRQSEASLAQGTGSLTPETEASGSTSRSYQIAAGQEAGRVDLWVDAFGEGDVVEIWQNGTRVAASGQAYVSGGGAVAAGEARSGQILLSFDYDPAAGQTLDFRFNEGRESQGAWVVGGLTLNPVSASLPSPSRTPSTSSTTGPVYKDITSIRTPTATLFNVATRDMTAGGLGLSGLSWTQPDQVLARVREAVTRASAASAHFGTQSKLVDRMMNQHSLLGDQLEMGIGNLVDADLAKEAARLKAADLQQSLAAQSLNIANSSPQYLLGLFKGAGR